MDVRKLLGTRSSLVVLGCRRGWDHLHTVGVAGSSPAAPTNPKGCTPLTLRNRAAFLFTELVAGAAFAPFVADNHGRERHNQCCYRSMSTRTRESIAVAQTCVLSATRYSAAVV